MSDTGLPLAEIWVLCGFFMIYLVEEVTQLVVGRCGMGGAEERAAEEEKGQMLGGHGHSHSMPTSAQPGFQASLYSTALQSWITVIAGIYTKLQAALRGFLVVLAISLHAVFEGIAMGLTNNSRFNKGVVL